MPADNGPCPAQATAQRWRSPWLASAPPYAPVPPPPHPTYDLDAVIASALEEDTAGIGDITVLSTIPESAQATGTFVAKADGTLAGLEVVKRVFSAVDPSVGVSWSMRDGDSVACGAKFGTVRGPARSILVAERVALNFLQRMSGIATATHAMVCAAQGHPARIVETRKTAPGLRVVDKWAVLIGGGANHRMGLFDMVMIKDNHIEAAGGIQPAVRSAQEYAERAGLGVGIEVEVESLEGVREVLALAERDPRLAVQRIMLDNMTRKDPAAPGGLDVTRVAEAVRLVGGRMETEASGNVVLATVPYIAATGVSHISCGALTHSVTALDISLRFDLG